MQRQRPQATVGDLLLDLAAGPDEDGRRARLVDRDARARDLGARRATERQDLAGGVDDDDDDAVALGDRLPLGGGEDRVGSLVIDDPAGAYGGHGWLLGHWWGV